MRCHRRIRFIRMMTVTSAVVALVLLFITIIVVVSTTTTVTAATHDDDDDAAINTLINKAVQLVQSSSKETEPLEWLQHIRIVQQQHGSGATVGGSTLTADTDDAIHQMAKYLLENRAAKKHKNTADGHADVALELLHLLADRTTDRDPHIPSQLALGFHYYEEDDSNKPKALHYFVLAGENGPNQAALYNAGRIYTEMHDYVPAMAYIRAAATFHDDDDDNASSNNDEPSKLTQTSRQAYEMLSQNLATQVMTTLNIEQAADLFLYSGPLHRPSDETVETNWSNAMKTIHEFNQTYIATQGQVQKVQLLVESVDSLRSIWGSKAAQNLSPLQGLLLLKQINDGLALLTCVDDKYLPAGAGYAEALARHQYCYEAAAASEVDVSVASCFNDAVTQAMAYYRRYKDKNGRDGIMLLAREHPAAATSWTWEQQTPQIYHSGRRAQPWWDPSQFEMVTQLQTILTNNNDVVQQELNRAKQLPTGSGDATNVEVGMQGNIMQQQNDKDLVGFQWRPQEPIVPFRKGLSATGKKGNIFGSWSEFGPLFNGQNWHAERCRLLPTLCHALKQGSRSLCTSHIKYAGKEMIMELDKERMTKLACGSDNDVVSIIRLASGTTVLPHCGPTNNRLLLHVCLDGCDGIEYKVGNTKAVAISHLKAVIFDDSIEHSIVHKGRGRSSEDGFILQAILAHPDRYD